MPSVTDAAATVATTAGAVEGSWTAGTAAFLGIPYAAPPVGRRRFARPEPAPAWDGVRPAVEPAVAPPQFAAPYAVATLGPMQVPGYDEDCLTLNVWSPSPGSDERLPVFVWFHGGGFVSGSGSAGWYDGAVLAARGRMVVVTVSYRLGALGYLYLRPGLRGPESVANLGLQDQILALQWVRDNVAAFGGDPDRVTVAGQSAGGLSIAGLHAAPRAAGLFRRAIIQSSPPVMSAFQPEAAEQMTQIFFDAAGVEPGDVDALLGLPVSEVINAQINVMMRAAMAGGGDPRMRPATLAAPLQLVVDGDVLPTDPAAAWRSGSMDGTDLLIACNAEEMRFTMAFDEAFWGWDREAARSALEASGGEPDRLSRYETYASASAGTPAEALCDMLTDETCTIPSIGLAEHRSDVGRPAHFAWFTWRSPAIGGRLGAAHCVEIPLVFNNLDRWSQAPMVTEADPAEVAALAEQVQDAWIAFTTTGDPGWPAYTRDDREAMEFGSSVGVVRDPAGDRRAHWAADA
jgi:para-nitrobenzyl esterase